MAGKTGLHIIGSIHAWVCRCGTMLAGRPWSEWIETYGRSHTHPFNQMLHLFGIPMIVLSVPMALGAGFSRDLGPAALGLFLLGWTLQFAGHAIERKPPEFLGDPRYLLVGVRWWWFKVRSRFDQSKSDA